MAGLTADVFRWHLDYFRSPGPQFYRLILIFVPALALLAWLYAAARQRVLWKWELHALAFLIVATCLVYEPRAFLFIAAVFLGASAGGGFAVRKLGLKMDGPLERIAVRFGAGAGILMVALFMAGMLRLLYASVFLACILAPMLLFWPDAWRTALEFRQLFKNWQASPAIRHPLAGVAIVFGFVAAVCALMIALAPSIAFDPVAIHLPTVQFYAQTHAVRPVPGIDYSYYPQGFEMLWTLALVLAGQPGAQMMSALFFPLFLMIVACLARECGLDQGAVVIAIACAATLPFLHWSGSVMKNDLVLAFFELLALYSFVRWLRDHNFRWIPAAAFFLAQAFSIKHVALFGALPLLALFGYAILRQSQRARAAVTVLAVLLLFGTYWIVRAYALTGNPVAPARLGAAAGSIGRQPPALSRRAKKFAEAPWQVLFHGLDAFESPLPNPAGILLFAFAPLALLSGRLRPRSGAQWACLLFAGIYLFYWAAILVKVRYAIAPFALLAVPVGAWMKQFYDSREAGVPVKISLIGVETYCLLIALMGLMIVGINAPQLAYFAGRLDKPGYLREAMQAYGAVEFLNRAGVGDAGVFGVENLARAYAPDPFRFQAIWCPKSAPCSAEKVVQDTRQSGAEYLILPENGSVPPDVLVELKRPERVYRDPHFSVYHLSR
jgi:Dolichyl-phosphate-mannose-protein mannosyltransferase